MGQQAWCEQAAGPALCKQALYGQASIVWASKHCVSKQALLGKQALCEQASIVWSSDWASIVCLNKGRGWAKWAALSCQ